MDLYRLSFGALTAANIVLGFTQFRRPQKDVRHKSNECNDAYTLLEDGDRMKSMIDRKQVREFQILFFSVYIPVVAADWLQVSLSKMVSRGNP